MAKYVIEETTLTNTANAIREKTGKTEAITPTNFASEIASIQGGGGMADEELTTSFMSLVDGTRGNRCTKLPEGLTTIGGGTFQGLERLALTRLPESITTIGYDAFKGCTYLDLIKLPESLIEISSYSFDGCSSLRLTELPNNLTRMLSGCFYGCTSLALTRLPNIVDFSNGTGQNGHFNGCTNIRNIVVPSVTTNLANSMFKNTSLDTIVIERTESVISVGANTFEGTPLQKGKGGIVVPENLLNDYKNATNWSIYADQIVMSTLCSLNIKCADTINSYDKSKGLSVEVLYNNLFENAIIPEQDGYTIKISGNATVDGNTITLTDDAKEGDIITLIVTSTYDSSITDTKQITVVYVDKFCEIDLKNGQWVDSGTTENGNIVYMSDAGSYHISNGQSLATISVFGYTKLTLYIKNSSEQGYDYVEAFNIDTDAVRSKGKFSGKGKDNEYVACEYLLDGEEHTIQILYSKDGSGDNNDDRGYFYIGGLEK